MKVTLMAMLITATLLASASSSFAELASFLQSSNNEEQLAKDTKPNVVTMKTDAGGGLTNKNGVVTVRADGAYFLMAAAQVGGKVAGSVRLWIKVNGKDVAQFQHRAGDSRRVLHRRSGIPRRADVEEWRHGRSGLLRVGAWPRFDREKAGR